MARYISYRCPDCQQTFRHLHHPSDAPPPDRCPLCGAWGWADEPPQVFVPEAPGIRKSTYAKSFDMTARNIEDASIQRADEAADQLRDHYAAERKANPHQGNEALLDKMERDQIAEMRSGLKVTNMRDPTEMREGDRSVIAPGPSPQQMPGAGFQVPGGFQMAAVPPAERNANFVASFTKTHNARAMDMIRAGRMNKS